MVCKACISRTNWMESQNVKPTDAPELRPRSYSAIFQFDYRTMEWMSRDTGIYIFAGLMVAVVLFSLWRTFLFFNVCMQASVNLHDNMFNSITRATMAFFNANPSGKFLDKTGVILNTNQSYICQVEFWTDFQKTWERLMSYCQQLWSTVFRWVTSRLFYNCVKILFIFNLQARITLSPSTLRLNNLWTIRPN